MRRHRALRLATSAALSSLAIAASLSSLHAQTSFEGVGFFDQNDSGRYSYATAVASSGLVVVGHARGASGTSIAYRWQNGGMTPLGSLSLANPFSVAYAVSADGAVVVGQSYNTSGSYQAFRWSGGVMTPLPELGLPGSAAFGVSADGSVIVGQSGYPGGSGRAVRWTGSTVTGLDFLNPLYPVSAALGVSSDGSIAVGSSASEAVFTNRKEAVMWSSSGAVTALGFLSPPNAPIRDSEATAIAGDNVTIVGDSSNANGFFEAFLWNGSSMVGLGFIDPTQAVHDSRAKAISQDATTVVGTDVTAGQRLAFRWQQATGMKSVRDLLVAGGVDMGTWQLKEATGVSANGLVIVGNGTDPNGKDQGWIARLDALTGLVTAPGLVASVGSLGQVPDSIDDRVDSLLNGQTGLAGHSGCGDDGTTMCTYAMGTGNDGFGLTGIFGMAAAPTSDVLVGVGGGYGVERGALSNGGSTDLRMPTAVATAAYAPDTGPQLIGSAAAFGINATIRRGYMNGVGTATSVGTTTGSGYGARAHVGWAFSPLAGATVTPFAEYEAVGLQLAGYTETGGPFPAAIGAMSNSEAISRLGGDIRVDLAPGVAVWGGLAWDHRFGNAVPAISATFPGLFSTTSPASAAGADWMEASASFRLPVSQQMTLSGGVTVAASAYQPVVNGNLALVRRF